MSPEAYNSKVGLCLACQITSQKKGYPFEVSLPTGLPVSGVVLSDQIKSLDWRIRKAEYICRLTDAAIGEILAKVAVLLQDQ